MARHAATERPFAGRFGDPWADGTYRCVGCQTVRFDAGTKFDAGCGSHLGQAIDDGPQPIGERDCINSTAIDFDPRR